jgi:hypothetical protein
MARIVLACAMAPLIAECSRNLRKKQRRPALTARHHDEPVCQTR